jgi:RND family efflux transporter MFP subunit
MQATRILAATFAGAALLAGCSKQEVAAPAPRAVIAQVVGAKAAASAHVYSGEVRARYENDLAFRVGGKVVVRLVDVGATVKKGQSLARLDPQDAQLGVESARSQLAAAQADHALAKTEVDRYRDLYGKKFVSQAVLDGRETTFNTTKARLEQAQAQLATAHNQSSYTSLVAEADGIITTVNVEAGQVVTASQPVMRFARPEEKEVAISVPESRLGELRSAREILVAVLAAPDKPYLGRVREIAPNADPVTRTFAAKISVIDPDAAVQLAALTQVDGKHAVWVVDPNTSTVNLRPVAIGAYREDGVVVRDGLKSGEVVVTAGVHKLLAGETVRVVSETLASPRSQQALDAALRPGS